MGLLVDKVSRKKLLYGAVIAFSLSTLVSATTSSFGVLLLMRFFLGALVSATEPAGFSMLGDLFPRSVRTTANSIVGTGSYLGSGLASFLILIVGTYGWRAAYAAKAAFGLITGLAAYLLLKEPERGMLSKIESEIFFCETKPDANSCEVALEEEKEDVDNRSLMAKFFGALTDLIKHPVAKWAGLGASLRYFGIFACDYYLPMFFLRNYPAYRPEFAIFYSLIVLFCGFSSALGGGIICDKFGAGKPMTKANVCIIGNMIAMPMFALGTLCTGNFWFSLFMIAGKYLFGEPWKSPAVTMMQNTTNPSKFGNIVSAYQFFYIMAGCLSTVLFGGLVNFLGCASNPVAIG